MKKGYKIAIAALPALGVFWFILYSVVIGESRPPYREAALSMLSCHVSLKDAALKGAVSLADLPSSCTSAVNRVEATPGGGMHLSNAEFGIELYLSPNSDGSRPWHCVGTPEKYVPKFCRQSQGTADVNKAASP